MECGVDSSGKMKLSGHCVGKICQPVPFNNIAVEEEVVYGDGDKMFSCTAGWVFLLSESKPRFPNSHFAHQYSVCFIFQVYFVK